MNRNSVTMAFAAAVVFAVCSSSTAPAFDMTWDGGDGFWNDFNWNGGDDPTTLVGVNDGADGFKGANDQVQNIFIGQGATVEYDADFIGRDFEMFQGSNLTIHEGATWLHMTQPFWAENRWTEMDLSNLVIDNGTFRRIGSVPGEGGGALIFGSWQGDDTFGEPEFPLDHQETNIVIKNGGRFENEGQLWFGSWEDTAENGTVISMTINDGTVDLTGGNVIGVGDEADADLVFTNWYPPSQVDNQPTYSINFTGPGSITVDSSGIINTFVDEFLIWQNLDPVTYQDLWDAGILQAKGQSGADGADFNQFFDVENSLGDDDYKLISKVTPTEFTADFDGDNDVDGDDFLAWQAAFGCNGGCPVDADGDDDTDGDDFLAWQTQFGGGVAVSTAVPEPTAATIAALAVLMIGSASRRRRRKRA